jgi:hypothetical protein
MFKEWFDLEVLPGVDDAVDAPLGDDEDGETPSGDG